MTYATIPALVLTVLLAVLAASTACRHTPTAPSPPVTWTISPTSAVMRPGDTAVFRFTSSAPPEGLPTCLFDMSVFLIAEFRVTVSIDLPGFGGTLPTTGECIVTLVRVFEPGRVYLTVQESLGTLSRPESRTVLTVPIDVER